MASASSGFFVFSCRACVGRVPCSDLLPSGEDLFPEPFLSWLLLVPELPVPQEQVVESYCTDRPGELTTLSALHYHCLHWFTPVSKCLALSFCLNRTTSGSLFQLIQPHPVALPVCTHTVGGLTVFQNWVVVYKLLEVSDGFSPLSVFSLWW